MQPFLIKRTKEIDLSSRLSEYVTKNYDQNSLSTKIQQYFGEVNQNRGVISKMGQTASKIDTLKQHINIVTHYINQLNTIKTKMTFGKENYSCKIEFTWSDTIKNSNWSSYNIYFEIYNTMFNLASLYYALGFFISQSENPDKNSRKEASKNFKYAMYIFNVIKEEAMTKIIEKELPIDLLPQHLEYCITMCIISGNIEILEIAKETSKTEFSLQSKIALTISENYKIAYDLSNEFPTKKGGEDIFRNYLLNRSFYYRGLMCKLLREANKKIFDNSGKNYGEILFFQGLFVEQLLECEKTVKKCGNYLNYEEFSKELEAEKEAGQDMLDKNDRIYHQLVPDGNNLNFEKKDMMFGILPEDLYIKENEEKMKNDNEIYIEDLDLLVPNEVKKMMDNYKKKVNELIGQNIRLYENENTINEFIRSLNLPERLTKDDKKRYDIPKEFPPQLWEKINKVRQMGGVNALTSIMNGIMNKSNFLVRELQNLLNSFSNEDADDTMCRQKYGNKWCRKPSCVLNANYVKAVHQYLDSLNNTKKYDLQENNDILNNVNYFEKILVSNEQLVNNIPKKNEINIKNSNEEAEVKLQINKLYELRDKCMNIINSIYRDLNDDSLVVGSFVQVLANKTTENAIFEKNKENFENKFAELKLVSDDIKNQKNAVNQACQKINRNNYNNQQSNMSQEAMNYFRDLDQCANLYFSKYDKIKKGDNYYNNLYQKIEEVFKKSEDWMIRRSDEKTALINSLDGKGGNKKNYLGESAFFDPTRNPYTNMGAGNKQGNYVRPGNQGNFGNNQGYGNQGGY